jgi:hypothetical protein
MGNYTELGKNLMLDALAAAMTHAGLFTAATAIASVTGAASTNKLTKVGHGLSNGDLVVLKAKTGGNGVSEEFPYYVVGVNGNDFQLARVPSGTAAELTTDISSVSVVKLTEISGGSPAYARKSTAYAAASGGSISASNQPEWDVPAGAKVSYIGCFSALTAGNLFDVAGVVEETFAGQGIFRQTAAAHNLNTIK